MQVFEIYRLASDSELSVSFHPVPYSGEGGEFDKTLVSWYCVVEPKSPGAGLFITKTYRDIADAAQEMVRMLEYKYPEWNNDPCEECSGEEYLQAQNHIEANSESGFSYEGGGERCRCASFRDVDDSQTPGDG